VFLCKRLVILCVDNYAFVMPAYSQLKVAELRQLCNGRQINTAGLTKPQLIAALRASQNDDDGDDERQDGEEEFDNGDGESSDADSVTDYSSVADQMEQEDTRDHEPESVAVLKLKLALAEKQAKWEKERDERATKARERQWEIERERMNLQAQLTSSNPTSARAATRADIHHLLPKMSADDDVLNFFHTFERAMLLNKVDKVEWPRYLPAQLNSKANKVLSSLSLQECENYDACKSAVLGYHQLGAASYLKAFRTQKRTNGESYKMFRNRLKEYFRYYAEAKNLEDFDTLADAMLGEQFLESLPADVRQFVLSKQPTDSEQCSEFADLYTEMMRNAGKNTQSGRNAATAEANQFSQPQTKGTNGTTRNPNGFENGSRPTKRVVNCWGCGSSDHKYAQCPRRNGNASVCKRCNCYHAINTPCFGSQHNAVYATAVAINDCDQTKENANNNPFMLRAHVNGRWGNALRDTGNDAPTLVDPCVVRPENYTGQYVYLKGVFDGPSVKRKIPLALVHIASAELGNEQGEFVQVGVCQMPPGVLCNISNSLFFDHPNYTDIFPSRAQITHRSDAERPIEGGTSQEVQAVTRAASRRKVINRDLAVDGQDGGRRDLAPPTENGGTSKLTDLSDSRPAAADITTDLELNEPIKTASTKAEPGMTGDTDRKQTHPSTVETCAQRPGETNELMTERDKEPWQQPSGQAPPDGDTADPDSDVDEFVRRLSNIDMTDVRDREFEPRVTNSKTADEFRLEQRRDPALAAWWTRAEAGSSQFRIFDGLLFKAAPPSGGKFSESAFQLIVPATHENEVIRLAHDMPLSGHLGIKRTTQRIASQFHFPKLKFKVTKHVKSCHKCQMTAPKRVDHRQPLQPIKILEKYPFEDISIDIVGPTLPQTPRKNKYLLTLVCNVSKWPHAIPLRNLKATHVADKILEFFCLVGFPKVVRMDNFSTFRSELLTALRDKLQIKALFSAPYHSESHGSVERTIKTLEDILKKFLTENPRTWDQLIPLLLFAIRSVPNESTKLSPSQLVYGREMRGLMSLTRELWTNGDPMEKGLKMSTVNYLAKLRTDIETALGVAKENVEQAQAKMKRAYDKSATIRELHEGQLALILLPTDGTKLTAAWRGPYTVLKRCENNNYQLDVNGRRATFHINELRLYHEREGGVSDDARVNMIINEYDDDEPTADDAGGTTQQGAPGGDFLIGDQLSPAQREAMQDLLARYGSVFCDAPGTTHLMQHDIKVTDEIPCWQPSYKIPEALKDQVEEELTKMLNNGTIEYNYKTKYNSPLIIVRKPNIQIRLVQNYISLNKKTVNEQCDMTNPHDLLNRAAGFRYVTKMDLSSGYHQVPLTPSCRHLTGFQTFMGSFVYKKMPQGLKCASFTFQRLMNKVLCGLHKFSGTLIDDTLVFSTTFESHLDHVRQVLDRISEAGLTVKKTKCHFATNRIQIFGHNVIDGLIYPDEDKVAAIAAWKTPKTKKELRSFLGLVGYFRQFVDKYSTIAYPLTELLRGTKHGKLTLTPTEQSAFDALRTALMNRPVLRPPDVTKPFVLMCDASKKNLSSILLQSSDGDGGKRHAVAYTSRKLADREKRYSVIELELLSILHGLQKFRYMILGCQISVYSDHKAIQWLNSLVKHSERLARWCLLIQEYSITTTYIRGEEQIADCLTRLD